MDFGLDRSGVTMSREIAVIGAAALMLAILVAAAVLPIVSAIVCGVVVVIAVLIGVQTGAQGNPGQLAQGYEGAAENKVLSSREFTTLASVAEALPDPFLVLDGEDDIVMSNAPARTTFEGVGVGRHISTVIRAPMVLDAIAQVSKADGSVQVDYEQRVPIERRFEVHIASISSGGAGGYSSGYPAIVLLLRDLTRQERVERMRADFVANASHELRTPLASVLGFIETLQGAARNDTKAREQFLELMRTQASRMARLIDELLSLNRIELNAHLHPAGDVDVSQVVGHVIEVLAPLALEKGTELATTAPDTPLMVRGERDELVQVFQNLIENAIKYGQSGKRVDVICARLDDGGIQITVRDYGAGIAPEHVPRLTERFYRVDVAESRQKGGTGLGLAIVKHILNRHRARLSINSRVGEGASFIVDLPGADSTTTPEKSENSI